MSAPGDREQAPGANYLLVLTATMAVGPLLTHSLSAMSPLVIQDLGLTESQFGLLATVTFFVAAVTAVRTGRWADRLGARTLLAVMFGGAVLAMLLTAAAPDYTVLLLAMALSGLGQVMANPTTNRLIRLHVPAHRRASWLGIKQARVQAAQLVAGLTFPALGLLVGWRTAVAVAAGVVLLLLVLAPLHPALAWAVWPAAVLHGGAALAVSVVVMSGAMRAVPAERVGASTGVVTMGLYTGFCAGPLVMETLLQVTGSFAVGWAVVLVCYLACGLLAVLVRWRSRREAVSRTEVRPAGPGP